MKIRPMTLIVPYLPSIDDQMDEDKDENERGKQALTFAHITYQVTGENNVNDYCYQSPR